MAISVGAHTSAADAATNTTTTAGVTTQATGSTFLVGIVYPNGDTVNSVTDNKSNTYTLIKQVADVGDGFKAAIYYSQNGAGGLGHTASLAISSTDPKTVYFTEILGGQVSGILDQNSGILDTATPFDSPVTTLQANELIYSLLASSGTTATTTWNGGFTALDSDVSGTITGSSHAARVVSATGTYSPAATVSVGGNAVVITASFIALTTGNTLTAATGTFTLSGQGASFASRLVSSAGIFSLVGQSATLTNAGSSVTIIAAPGAFNVAGGQSTTSQVITAAFGPFVFTGVANTLIWPQGGGLPDPGNLQFKNVFVITPSGSQKPWVDYIPCVFITVTQAKANRYDFDGALAVKSLASVTGLIPWVNYIPVATSVGTATWRTDDVVGYIPMVKLI